MNETELRASLVAALHADLIGPFVPDSHAQGGQEVLPLPPSRWYLTGFLAPQGGRAPEVDDAESGDGGLAAGSEIPAEETGTEEPEPKRPVRFAASMGLSVFLPPGKGDSLDVEVWYADYDKVEVAIDHTDKKRIGYKRVPYGPICVAVPLDSERLNKGVDVPGSRGLVLRGELRTTKMDGLEADTRVLSLFLVNGRAEAERDRDAQFAFQVKLALSFKGGFRSRPNWRGEEADDDDQRVLALNFHEHVEWAVGHNTSVEQPDVVDGEVTRLVTTQLPTATVPRVVPRAVDDVTVGMADLAKLSGLGGEALRNALTPLVEAYGRWIDEQRDISLPRESLRGTRDELLKKAHLVKDRVREGVELLVRDEQVRSAFQLANKAMHLAAIQADSAREDRRYVGGKSPEWRPFQLAFLLMSLPSSADPAHPDRKLAELIYFPTGGGKTEAYLGLIAFVLVLRRLRGKGTPHEGRGVAVLLRLRAGRERAPSAAARARSAAPQAPGKAGVERRAEHHAAGRSGDNEEVCPSCR